MQEADRIKIKSIKSKIATMLQERHSLEDGNKAFVSPSEMWSLGCSNIDYMLWLPEEYFAKLRMHTYHFTGDNYQTYFYADPEWFRSAYRLAALTKDIPAKLVLNEPEGGIGFHYGNGRFVSVDITRFQRVVNNLYRSKVLADLSQSNRPTNYILEIGAGYGGLAHHLSNILDNVTYVIVDLPETLLFSASYLSLHNPQKKIYVYDPSDFSTLMQGRELDAYDFVLLPNYQLQSIRWMRFDLILNMESLGEMTTRQAEEYLDFIKDTCAEVFYSLNQDRVIQNYEMSSVSELLARRFSLTDLAEQNLSQEKPNESKPPVTTKTKIRRTIGHVGRRIADVIGLSDEPEEIEEKNLVPVPVYPPHREYLCRPLTK